MPINYSQRQYPLATQTFTCYRRNQTQVQGNNVIPLAPTNQTPIATGLSIFLRDLEDVVVADKDGAGYIQTGRFLGGTFNDTPVQLGDILADETQNDIYGNPVRYFVDGLSRNIIYCELHLQEMQIGI